MNFLKDEDRNSMRPDHLDGFVRIFTHEDNVDTFDVNKATNAYLKKHLRCDGNAPEFPLPSDLQRFDDTGPLPPIPPREEICHSAMDEARMEVADMESQMENNGEENVPLPTKAAVECIAIINKDNGKALTSQESFVTLSTVGVSK